MSLPLTRLRPCLSRARGQISTELSWAALVGCAGLLFLATWNRPGDVSRELLDGLLLAGLLLTTLVVLRQLVLVRRTLGSIVTQSSADEGLSFRSLVQNLSDVVLVVGADAVIHYPTPSVERVFGLRRADLEGTRLTDQVHPDDVPRVWAFLAEAGGQHPRSGPAEWRLRHGDGTWRQVEVSSANLLDDPRVGGLVLEIRDVTARRSHEEQLSHQAFRDPLTGLANRALFRNRVEHALARGGRYRTSVAVLFLDLDDFKAVNDRLGHAAGDQLLVAVAERLDECVRTADTAARLGGDEFGVLLDDSPSASDAPEVAERILESLRTPFRIENEDLFVHTSIGIAVSADSTDAVDDLLRMADIAMYAAKGQGKNRYAIFHPEMNEAMRARLALKSELEGALEREELSVYYQPTVTLRTGAVAGLEALVRWAHPERGLIPANEFLPLAEETGLIIPIGRWVLRRACHQASAWHVQYPSDPPLQVNVNLSPKQLQHPDLVADVARVLEETKLDPASLILDISERVVMQDGEATHSTLVALKELGLRLAVDDFGSGFSSLSYLRRSPIDILKIDKLFVEGICEAVESSALASAIIELGRALDLQVVAEGIEVSGQLDRLRELGCEMGQGYFFAHALPKESVGALITAARSAA